MVLTFPFPYYFTMTLLILLYSENSTSLLSHQMIESRSVSFFSLYRLHTFCSLRSSLICLGHLRSIILCTLISIPFLRWPPFCHIHSILHFPFLILLCSLADPCRFFCAFARASFFSSLLSLLITPFLFPPAAALQLSLGSFPPRPFPPIVLSPIAFATFSLPHA